jgi:hypothetical protein
MPPEETPDQIPSDSVVQDIEWDGPWGSIDPTPHSVETLCVQLEQEAGRPRIYYYPYRTIGKWNWSMDRPETLEIHAGGVQLTISGTGLRRLAEALNLGQLQLVQLNQPPNLTGVICIQSILVGDSVAN